MKHVKLSRQVRRRLVQERTKSRRREEIKDIGSRRFKRLQYLRNYPGYAAAHPGMEPS